MEPAPAGRQGQLCRKQPGQGMFSFSLHGQPPADKHRYQAYAEKGGLQRRVADQQPLRRQKVKEAAEPGAGQEAEKMGPEVGPGAAGAEKGEQTGTCSQGEQDLFYRACSPAHGLVTGKDADGAEDCC